MINGGIEKKENEKRRCIRAMRYEEKMTMKKTTLS